MTIAQIGYLKFRNLDLGSQPKGIYTTSPFISFKGSIATSFMLIFGNNWIDIFFKSLRDFGEVAAIYYFCIVLLTKQILFSIIVAFLLEHMKRVIEKINLANKKRMIEKINIMKKVGFSMTINKLKGTEKLRANIQHLLHNSPGFQKPELGVIPEVGAPEKTEELKLDIPLKAFAFNTDSDQKKGIWAMSSSPSNFSFPLTSNQSRKSAVADSNQLLSSQRNSLSKKLVLNVRETKKSSYDSDSSKIQSLPKLPITGKQILEGIVRFPNTMSSPSLPELDDSAHQSEEPKLRKSKRTIVIPKLPEALFQSPDPYQITEPEETSRPLFTTLEDKPKDEKEEKILETEVENQDLQTKDGKDVPVIIHYRRGDTLQAVSSRTVQMKESFCYRRMESSYFIFHKNSWLRMKLIDSLESNTFNYIFIGVITCSLFVMIFDEPYLNHDTPSGQVIWWFDLILNTILSIEFLWKSCAYGAILSKGRKKAYLMNPENWLDILVIVITWVCLNKDWRHRYLLAMKPLRTIRLLDFLKIQGQSHTFQLILDTIGGATSRTFAFLIFIYVCLQPFVAIMMHMHGKTLYDCKLSGHPETFLPRACSSTDSGKTYKVGRDFRGYGEALLSSLVVLTNEGFHSFTRYIMTNEGTNDLNYLDIVQTVLAYYFIALFLQNMFACVTFLVYSEKKQSLDRTSNLTEKERQIFDQQKVFISKKLVSHMEHVKHKITFLTTIIESVWTELLSFILLFVSIILLCFEGGDNQNSITTAVQIVILAWFNIEILLKMYSTSLIYLLGDGLNVLDILCTLSADILLVLYFTIHIHANFMVPILIKFFGIGRALRRVLKLETKISKSMKSLFDALIASFIHILPILVILVIVQIGFAISAMNLFFRIPKQTELNLALNFESFTASYLSILK